MGTLKIGYTITVDGAAVWNDRNGGNAVALYNRLDRRGVIRLFRNGRVIAVRGVRV